MIHAFSYKEHFYVEIAKNQHPEVSIILGLNLCYLKTIRFLHPRYHSKIIGYILKMCKKQVCLF